jgi:hypothetical protein
MAQFEPVSPPHIAAIQQPGCPQCRQQRMRLAKLGSGPSGIAAGSFECRSCGYVSTTAISGDPRSDDPRYDDPMTSDVLGWLASELRPPT